MLSKQVHHNDLSGLVSRDSSRVQFNLKVLCLKTILHGEPINREFIIRISVVID